MNNEIRQLTLLKQSSCKAFGALYKQYFDTLYSFVFTLVRSHDKTSDIVQETFIRVWINRQKIDTDLSFKAWLYKIAKNLILNEFRKQIHSPLFEDYINYCHDEQLSINNIEETLDFDKFYKVLEKAKLKLSPRQREVFDLLKEQDFSIAEVSKKLKISTQVVYNYLSQALIILRKEMSSYHISYLILLLLSKNMF